MTFNLKPLNVGFHAFELNFNINYKIFLAVFRYWDLLLIMNIMKTYLG